MGLIISIIVSLLAALVIICVMVFMIMEAIDKGESLRKKFPLLEKFMQQKESLKVLLLTCIIMLILNTYEVISKEVPEVAPPPNILVKAPRAPNIQPQVITHTLPAPPQPLRIRTAEVSFNITHNGKPGMFVAAIGLTTVPITPVDVTLTCDQDMDLIDTPFLGAGLNQYDIHKINARSWIVKMTLPPWTPETPLEVKMFTEAKDLSCEFKQN